MSEPGSGDKWDMCDEEHALKHAMKRMEHDMKHAVREQKRAVKQAFKCGVAGFENAAGSGPSSVDEVLVEIDSYLSYLEDLPKERLAGYADKVDRLAEHLENVRKSLKKGDGQ